MSAIEKVLEMKARFGQFGYLPIVVTAMTLVALAGCGSGSSSSSGSTQTPTLLIADSYNNRVLTFDSPFITAESATTVLGQVDFTRSVQATTANGLAGPIKAVTDGQGNVWVSDVRNNRILRFGPPFTDGAAADLVIGQMNFTTGGNSTSLSDLALPHGLVFDKKWKSLGCQQL